MFLSKVSAHKRESVLKQLRDLWTHNSNAIEGNTLSLGDTHFILEEGLTISGKPLREHQEVIGHARAIDILYNSLSEPLSKKLLFELHKAVQTETVTDIYKPYDTWKLEPNGTYAVTRDDKQVYIEYARPIDIEKLMSELTQAVSALPRLSIEQAAVHYAHIHAAFVHIHPFFDGNGRIARLIANIPLLKSGLPPFIIDIKSRQEYIQILAEYEMATGQLNTNSGIWPDKGLLKEFEAFCTAQYKRNIAAFGF